MGQLKIELNRSGDIYHRNRQVMLDTSLVFALLSLDLCQKPIECHLGATIARGTDLPEDATANEVVIR